MSESKRKIQTQKESNRKPRTGLIRFAAALAAFLLLFGAGAVVLESLRYDRFLSISFVGLQQIAAAIMLAIGVVIAFKRGRKRKPRLAIAALISLPLMVGIVLGLEFALDRTTWNKLLLYAIMILTVAAPAAMGLRLLDKETEGK